MDNQRTIQRLRLFLLCMAALIFAGTPVELFLSGHYDEPLQYIPFVLCGLGLTAVAIAMLWPMRKSLIVLRVVMGLIALGSLFGMVEHLSENLAFAQEIVPNASMMSAMADALRGAAPLLAPGILIIAALLAAAATTDHPLLLSAGS